MNKTRGALGRDGFCREGHKEKFNFTKPGEGGRK